MITCDKCGFGHKTFEEKHACKSWDEIAAATQEQPAGSGATLSNVVCAFNEQTYCLDVASCTGSGVCQYPMFKGKREVEPGSPRKVGEDAPGQLMTATGPISLADFSRNLADDIYAISDGAAPDRETLRAMIRARLEVGLKYWKWERLAARPSSVPVGEQKQEEGV